LPALEEARPRATGFSESAIDSAIDAANGGPAKRLIDAIQNPKTPLDDRVRAISSLGWGEKADEKVVTVLTLALKDSQAKVRAAAMDSLGLIGTRAKAAIPAMIERLGDNELEKAARESNIGAGDPVTEALTRMGADAVPGLAAVFKDDKKEPLVRYAAVKTLTRIGGRAGAALPVLEAGLREKAPLLAIESAGGYARAGGDVAKALPVLRSGLKHDNAFVAWSAARAIGDLGLRAKELVPDLVPQLRHKDADVRIASSSALSKMGPPRSRR